jgi:hypothetical protein
MTGAVALTSSQAKPPRFQMYVGGQCCDLAYGNYRSVQSPHSGRVVAERLTELTWITVQVGHRKFPF